MTASEINTLGLALDIIGAALIWFFVAEINFASKEDFLKGEANMTLADPTPKEIWIFRRNVYLSRFGMFLLIVGFSLQVAGNWFNEIKSLF